ncbi:MAG: tyrosine--tRNA ligase [Myxococcales bacterium]|nr:tyrosine--tRNA ligase [Myxococcales bacterium]
MTLAPLPAPLPAAPLAALTELTRGVVDLHVRAELAARLAEGRPLRVKAGFDPTRPDLHLGHTVLMRKMRQFQDLGHTVVFLVGDYTAMVGDPTGRNKLRPQLSREDVAAAARTYVDQACKILDRERTEVRFNSEWLDTMKPMDLVQLMAKSTVSQMLERNDFKQRFAAEKPIFQHELLYPLLQAYDSVALDADVEIGGTDQLFNLMVGRDLMPQYGKRPQIVMTTPLLEGIDARIDPATGRVQGDKMSKSANNYVGIDEPPAEQFRKLMLVDDQVVFRYFELLSAKSAADIEALRADVAAGKNPKDAKKLLADEIVTQYHGAEAAVVARKAWDAKFEADAIPDDVAELRLPCTGEGLWLPKALHLAKLVASSSQGKQLVEQGGVEVDQIRITDVKRELAAGGTYLVRVGSKNRKFARLVVERA